MMDFLLEIGDRTAREITNGMWFVSNVFLLTTMLTFLIPKLLEEPWVWRQRIEVKIAWGFTLIVFGSSIRSGWIWALLVAENRHSTVAQALRDVNYVSFIAIGFCVWGTICIIKAFEPFYYTDRQTRIHLSVVAFFTIFIPLVMHLIT